MDIVLNYINSLPLWIVAGGGGAVIILIAVLITILIYRKKKIQFIKYMAEALENNNFSTEIYSEDYIRRHSKTIENFADSGDYRIIGLTNLDKHWLQQLNKKPKEKDIKRILKYIPDKGLFSCFLAGLEKNSLIKIVLQFIGDEPGSLRKLPLSGSGEPFDGNAARLVLAERMDEIREMAGDPEWPVRYFAIKLLLNEDSGRSERGIVEAFNDPHPLIRKSVVSECLIENREELYKLLYQHLLDDPSFEVRESAYLRIMAEYKDIHSVDYSSLTPVQSLHALEFLNSELPNDIDAALHFLEGSDLELRFPSAIFLQETGTLEKMLKEVSFEDTDNLKRTNELLSNAAEVKVTGFLRKGFESPASLYTVLSLLKKVGEREYIADYASKVFTMPAVNNKQVWENAVECIKTRGNERAVNVLMKELSKIKYNESQAGFILENLPENYEFMTMPPLMDLLTDADFRERDHLVNAIARLPEDIIIPELFKILKKGRSEYPHAVRISALQILARYKLPYCLQPIIEQLPTLPVKEAKEFSALLSDFEGETFSTRVLKLLKQPDGKVRAAIIASLPGTEKKEFLIPIKEALSDADPDVRIASIWALADYRETKMLNQGFEMLRDPVERVRIAAAEVLGIFGTSAKLEQIAELLKDENEVIEVKQSAILGLSKSDQTKAVDILTDIIDKNEELQDDAVKALSRDPSKKIITRIIENMKDASPTLREKIIVIFKLMGASGEEALKKLLAEDITSLKESISVILEETGYVEHVIRKLSHRDPGIRRAAAGFLSMIGTKSAFRGIVLASRDPDNEVRIQVTRALEKLSSPGGEEILETLKSDPDKRVRKFTAWALARTKAKRIED